MLNTKPIRTKVFDELENTNLKNNLGTDANINNKFAETNDSISSKEIIKLHNENLNTQKENTKIMEEIVKQREVNTLMNNTRGGYQNNTASNLQTRIINNNDIENTMHEENNDLIRELAAQIKNELKPKPQVIVVAPPQNFENNLSEKLTKNKLSYTEWDEDKNSYVIYDNGEIEGFFTNNDIVKSIISGSNINKYIKKYFFIIAYNKETDTNEFNFIDSTFTNNLELIIKIQNSLFDLSNQGELFEENEEYSSNLLIFNYQFIIYLFKKSNYLNNNESNKIAKFYSTITYRFTTLVLKQTMKIENVNITLANDIVKLIDIKNDISGQLKNIEDYLSNNDTIDNKSNKNKKNNKNSNDLINIINITTTEDDTEDDTDESENNNDNDDEDNNKEEINIKNKSKIEINSDNIDNTNNTDDTNNTDNIKSDDTDDNKNKSAYKTKSILDDIISSLSSKFKQDNNYDSEDNGYEEINDDVSSYKDKQISGSMKSTNISSTSNNINDINVNKMHYKIANKNISTTDPSYNKNSAINNGKIYKIKL
jgi:hypothetical protein